MAGARPGHGALRGGAGGAGEQGLLEVCLGAGPTLFGIREWRVRQKKVVDRSSACACPDHTVATEAA